MPLSSLLSPARTTLLQGDTRWECLEELIAVAAAADPRIDAQVAFDRVMARERDLSTELVPGVAIPHGRLPNLGKLVVAVGLHLRGVEWGTPQGTPVRLVVLLLGDEALPDAHISALADLAQTLGRERALREILASQSVMELYEHLTGTADSRDTPEAHAQTRRTRAIVEHALALTQELGAGATLVFADDLLDLDVTAIRPRKGRLVLATSRASMHVPYAQLFDAVLEVPGPTLSASNRVSLGLLFAITEGVIDRTETVVCAHGAPGSGGLDGVSVVDVATEFHVLFGLPQDALARDVDHRVLHRVLNLALSIASEGREGHPIGTMFVLGDHERVRAHSNQIIINPFRGYADEERNILDPSLEETVKELAGLDGAFVVRGDGVIVSAGTAIAGVRTTDELPSGLGTRHAAGMGVSGRTGALAVVVSASTGTVSVYKSGNLLMSLKRELR